MKLLRKAGSSERNVPLLLLTAAGVLEFMFITMVAVPSYLGYYLAETYLILPCLLFLGYALQNHPDAFSRRRLLLGAAAAAWFMISQIQHKLSGMENQHIGNVFFVYLMAFPFASVINDRENAGILRIGKILSAASLVLVGCTVLLMLDLVPEGWKDFLYWDGTRLCVFWHPNISACYFLAGMGFCTVFLIRNKKPLVRVLLAVAVAVQFLAMALTNCRTTLLMTGALFGGIVFFGIFRGSWKRLIPGLLAAAVILVGSFKLSGAIYQWNADRIEASILALLEENSRNPEESENQGTYQYSVKEDGQVTITTKNAQESLAKDMASLNGRTYIWSAALQAIRENKTLAWWGTEYSGTVISVYSPRNVEHSHNSWMEVLLRTGIPGLVIALVFTVVSTVSAAKLLLNRETELWKKMIAMMTMCVMVAGFLEPYLFGPKTFYHVIDFIFFFCTGYLNYWCRPRENT